MSCTQKLLSSGVHPLMPRSSSSEDQPVCPGLPPFGRLHAAPCLPQHSIAQCGREHDSSSYLMISLLLCCDSTAVRTLHSRMISFNGFKAAAGGHGCVSILCVPLRVNVCCRVSVLSVWGRAACSQVFVANQSLGWSLKV
jgi:hypothetical protein